MRRSAAGLTLAMLAVLLATSTAMGATTIYVDASATGGGTGSNWSNAYPKLQDALATAASGDQIWVAAGVYYPDEGGGMANDDYTSTFTMIDEVELYGGFAGGETTLGQRDWVENVTVLSGDIDQNDSTDINGVVTDVTNIAGSNAYHVVMGGGTWSAVLDGFTITAGKADGIYPDNNGGGMYNASSSPTLTNVSFAGNQATSSGGGMYNNNSSNPILTNLSFSGNQAGLYGGGMYNILSSPTLATGSFTGNQAQAGGGIYDYQSNPTLTDVAFSNNQADLGGGIYSISNSNPILTNVSFSANQATNFGGGMYNQSSGPTLTGVTFSGNQADKGGGMYDYLSNSALTNVSFTGNYATSSGGGMIAIISSPTLTNTILWNNQAGSFGHQIDNFSSTPVIAYSDIQGSGGSGIDWDTALGTDGGNNIDADPLFVTPVDPATAPTTAGDLRLQVGSPAVDAGDNGVCPASDLDGNSRPIDGDGDGSAICDMGAYEKPISLFLPLIMR